MNAHPRDTKPHREHPPEVAPSAREADPERQRERRRRIAAAQMAAPSTRRWRRAGRFGSS